jgi:Asp-tRNA(Asn)/Glu-tRNA(Gln) amidotransferase A subunit family amidase
MDRLGPVATNVCDLTLAYNAMQRPDHEDPFCADRPAEPVDSAVGIGELCVWVLGG